MKLYFFSTLFTPMYINYYYVFNIFILVLAFLSIIIHKSFSKKNYLIIIINVILELLFNIFLLSSNVILLFMIKLLQFILSIHLNEIIYDNKKSAKLLMPYILWNYLLTLYIIVSILLNLSI